MKRSLTSILLLMVLVLLSQVSSLASSIGKTPHSIAEVFAIQDSPCFAIDPGLGNTNRDEHYRWAQQQDSTKLMNNLAWKIGILFNCSSVSGDQLAKGFGQMSGIIADYVSNPTCFNDDPHVTGRDRSAHEKWARTKTREQVRDNLQWKAVAAMKCLNRESQLAFFADESAALARVPSSSEREGGGGESGSGRGGGNCPGVAGYSVTIEPNTARIGDSITVRLTIPGGNPPQGSWVGIFKGDSYLNYSYLADLKPSFTRIFPVPMDAGQFEVRVLLDSGYSNVAVRCNFTVQQ